MKDQRQIAENTKRSYLTSHTTAAVPTTSLVQDYLIYLHEQRGLLEGCNCVRHGVRFLYRITLGVPDPHFYVPGAKTPSTLPEILNHEELVRLFTVTTNPKHRSVLMTAYAAGLRASELGRLRVSDIDSKRMCLRVDQGKGNKDRYVPLSPRLLQLRSTGAASVPSLGCSQMSFSDARSPTSSQGEGWNQGRFIP